MIRGSRPRLTLYPGISNRVGIRVRVCVSPMSLRPKFVVGVS